MFVRQRFQQHRVDHAEDGGVGADSQAQRQHRRQRESRILAHHAQCKTGILREHGGVLARRGLENSHDRFPPQAQHARDSAAARRFFALFVEDRFHFRAEIAAKIERQKSQ